MPRVSAQHTTTASQPESYIGTLLFKEIYSKERLRYILQNKEFFKKKIMEGRKKEKGPDYNPFETAELFMTNGSYDGKNHFIHASYFQNNKFGRHYASDSLSLQNMTREIRHSIACEFYDDLDMVNAHPNLLEYLCKKHKIDCPNLKEYNKNRDVYINQLIIILKNRDLAKKVLLSVMNGGSKDYNACIEKITDDKLLKFMEEFKIEMKGIAKKIADLHKEAYSIHAGIKEFNTRASFMNTLLCDIENKVLTYILSKLNKNVNCVLCFDGIMIPKVTNENIKTIPDMPTFIIELEKSIKRDLDIDIKLKIKPMDEGFWDYDGNFKYTDISYCPEPPTLHTKLRQIILESCSENGYTDALFAKLYECAYSDMIRITLPNGSGYIFDNEVKLWKECISSEMIKLIDEGTFKNVIKNVINKYSNMLNTHHHDSLVFIKTRIYLKYAETWIKNIETVSYRNSMMSIVISHFYGSHRHFAKTLNLKGELYPIRNNQVINLRTKIKRDRVREDYFSFSVDVDYVEIDFDIEEDIENMIFPIFCNNSEYINYMQLVLGSFLTTVNKFKTVFLFHGEGQNGKSKLLKMLSIIMKGAHGHLIKEALVSSKDAVKHDQANGHTVSLIPLEGNRFYTINELDRDDVLRSALFKCIASSDDIILRAPYEIKNRTIEPVGKMIIATNHIPKFDFDDSAMINRLTYCPFYSRFVDKKYFDKEKQYTYLADDNLITKFLKYGSHLDGMFSWMVDGAYKYLNNELPPIPKIMDSYKKEKIGELDLIGLFIQEKLTMEKDAFCGSTAVHDLFVLWAKDFEFKISKDAFSKKMVARLGKTIRRGDIYGYEHYRFKSVYDNL